MFSIFKNVFIGLAAFIGSVFGFGNKPIETPVFTPTPTPIVEESPTPTPKIIYITVTPKPTKTPTHTPAPTPAPVLTRTPTPTNQIDSTLKVAQCQARAQKAKDVFLLAADETENKFVTDIRSRAKEQIDNVKQSSCNITPEEKAVLTPTQINQILSNCTDFLKQEIDSVEAWEKKQIESIHQTIDLNLRSRAPSIYSEEYLRCLNQ